MAFQDLLKHRNLNGVVIDYELLGKVLNAKRERFNNPVIEDNTKYLKRKLAVIKTVYPTS
jgi:hypothetical protein